MGATGWMKSPSANRPQVAVLDNGTVTDVPRFAGTGRACPQSRWPPSSAVTPYTMPPPCRRLFEGEPGPYRDIVLPERGRGADGGRYVAS